MPRHQGNVDVAALADRLAVVHGFEHGQAARMLLDLAREGVEIARPLVSAERLPCGQDLARGGYGGVHIGGIRLSDFGKRVAAGRIAGRKIFAADRLDPRAAYERIEPAVMPLQPLHRFFRIFRRGSVFHGVELFGNAHCGSFQRSNAIYAIG
jgi:hypothetical protein